MDCALAEHKEQDLYEPSVQPCSGRAWGWAGTDQAIQMLFPAMWKMDRKDVLSL